VADLPQPIAAATAHEQGAPRPRLPRPEQLIVLLFAALLDVRSPPPEEREVQALVAEARRGSQPAARRLYALHAAVLFRTVRPLCRNEADAEDVVQETFAKALSALDRYEQRPGKRFVSWLITIGLNGARKALRRRRRVTEVAPDRLCLVRETASGSDDPAGEQLDRRRRRAVLLRLLDELDERDREILTLRYAAELSVAEVAELCGVGPANVRKICERQRRRLLDRLRAELQPETTTQAGAVAKLREEKA